MSEQRSHTLVDRGIGPYRVARFASDLTVNLETLDGRPAFKDPVPVSELTGRVQRKPLTLPEEPGTRSLADALDQKAQGEPYEVLKKGWANLHKGNYIAYVDRRAEDQRSISVGAVLEGCRQDRSVLVHCMRPCHDTVNLKWKRVYFLSPSEGDTETLEVLSLIHI